MKLEKFDLEKALNGAKIVTRDGREVTQLTKFKDAEDYPLGAVIEGKIQSWNIDGYYYIEEESDTDLFLAVEPQRIWVNAYYFNGKLWIGSVCYNSEAKARTNSTSNTNMVYIKTIEITDEI
jgi:hypothetical protein